MHSPVTTAMPWRSRPDETLNPFPVLPPFPRPAPPAAPDPPPDPYFRYSSA